MVVKPRILRECGVEPRTNVENIPEDFLMMIETFPKEKREKAIKAIKRLIVACQNGDDDWMQYYIEVLRYIERIPNY